ncbi:MAG TPA: hypothetical protein PKA74_12445 [Bauldia sp.]|nr:hypothetical protein [Bauldia sp.]
MLVATPLTIIPLILFNILALTVGTDVWTGTVFGLTMLSGARWVLSVGDLMIILGIGMLFAELMKSARASSSTILNHILSTVVLIVYIIEFIVVGVAANSIFFILTVIALFDVVLGFSISIRTATRDISMVPPMIDGAHGGG